MNRLEQLVLIESIIESSPVIVFRWIIRDDWPVEYVSKNISHLGYSQEQLLTGAVAWTRITHPDDLLRLQQEVETYLSNNTDSWSQTYRIRASTGEYRWIRDWNLILRNEQGQPEKIQSVLIDITPEKNEEYIRQASQDTLEKALSKIISGCIPICAGCKSIRDEAGHWAPLENYFSRKSPVSFSHGLCPTCGDRMREAVKPLS